jgi:hypothetical protein
VTAQWTPAQVHDTVAAIVAQPAYRAERRSLLARFIRLVADQFEKLLDAVRGSLDARVVIAVAVAAIVLVIAARVAMDRRAAARRARHAARFRATGGRRDAWAEARASASAGNYAEASHAIYVAVLEVLTTAGVVRYHRSKTAGDYARELRHAGSPLAGDFRMFGRGFDHLAFGQADAAAPEDYARLASLAERIVSSVHRAAA